MKWTNTKLFNASYKQGVLGEQVICNYLKQNKGLHSVEWNLSKNIGELRKWDFKGMIGTTKWIWETKTDLWEYYNKKITGNIFIEVSCAGHPSGISATGADYFIYYYPQFDFAYQFYVPVLKDYLWHIQSTGVSPRSGGDGNAARGYVLKRTDIEATKLFTKLPIKSSAFNIQK